jgi:hypothetical protein
MKEYKLTCLRGVNGKDFSGNTGIGSCKDTFLDIVKEFILCFDEGEFNEVIMSTYKENNMIKIITRNGFIDGYNWFLYLIEEINRNYD